MPKIAIICNNAFTLAHLRSSLIKDFVNRGDDVFVLAPDYSHKYRKHVETLYAKPVDITMDRNGKNIFKDLGTIYSIAKKLRCIQPDITFSYYIKPVVYGLIASRIARIPHNYAMIAGLGIMYTKNGESSFKETLQMKCISQLYRFSLRYADKVFFQNPDDIELFKQKNILHRKKPILLNGSGIDIDIYQTNYIQKQPITFTLAARLIKEKGVQEFAEAAHKLKDKFKSSNIRFILLGDTDTNPNSISRNEAENWSDKGILEWYGHVYNVKEWLEKTSVFVLPTYYREGIPRSILEAMSMSRPIITTDMPGSRETVEEGENGFLIQPKNVEELVSAMEKFIKTPSLIETFGQKSRRIAEEKYDVRKVNKKMLKFMKAGE